jgi:hypothetical protein
MKSIVEYQEIGPVKFCQVTIAGGRIERATEIRNPQASETIQERSRAVHCEVGEAVQQQWWADDER